MSLPPVVRALALGGTAYACVTGVVEAYAVLLAALVLVEGWSPAMAAPAYGLASFVAGAGSLVVGHWYARWSPRVWFAGGLIFGGVSLGLSALASVPWVLWLTFGLGLGLATAATGLVPMTAWLVQLGSVRLGYRLAVFTALAAGGGLGCVWAFGYGIEVVGWRGTCAGVGVLLVVLGFALTWPVYPAPVASASPVAPDSTNGHDWLVWVGDPVAWRIILCNAIAGAAAVGHLVFAVLAFVGLGLTPAAGAFWFGLMLALNVPGLWALGWLFDHRHRELAIAVSFVMPFVGLILVGFGQGDGPSHGVFWPLLLYVGGFAISYGSRLAMTTEALTRVLSGRLSASRAAALVLMAGWGGAGLGGILAGLVAAAYGVAGVLWGSAGLLVVAYGLYLWEPALRGGPAVSRPVVDAPIGD